MTSTYDDVAAGGWLRHKPKLREEVGLVVVELDVSGQAIRVPTYLDALDDHCLSGWKDDPRRSLKGTRMRALEGRLLDNPGAAHDLLLKSPLGVRETLEPDVAAAARCLAAPRSCAIGRLEHTLANIGDHFVVIVEHVTK